MSAARVLVIDDDPQFIGLMEVLLESHGYEVVGAAGLTEAVADLDPAPAAVLLDWHLGEQDGLELLTVLRERLPASPVVLTTAHSSTEVAVKAIKLGAFEFLPKPVDEARLVAVIASAAAQSVLLGELQALRATGDDRYEGMIGSSPAMRAVFDTIESVARTDASVLITGESGTGKELVARAIHRRSGRRGAFVALNMAAIPRELVESTLFGHEKGAFSGADRRRVGACEEAQGGTLFLDEVGEMPIDLQVKLLRFLQEQVIRRVGGSEDLALDARVVSATNRDPLQAIEAGQLRSDLYYRLNVVPVALPALRDRPEDVGFLATAATRDAARRYGKDFTGVSPEAIAILERHPWPGNVRELVHAMERVVIMNRGELVEPGMLPREGAWAELLSAPASSPTRAAVASAPLTPRREVVPLAELERRAILHALEVSDGNRNDAAQKLGISPATIYRKLGKYGISGGSED